MKPNKIKALVVGSSELTGEEGLEVVRQIPVRFAAYAVDCWHQLNDLRIQAKKAGAMLIFRDAPPQVLKALSYFKNEVSREVVAGVIIMKPNEQSATESEWRYFTLVDDPTKAEELVHFANPSARTKPDGYILTVTVTKPEFSHIEWF